jgi:hypothetical protein
MRPYQTKLEIQMLIRLFHFLMSPTTQRLWIRKHPVKYVVLNVVIGMVTFGAFWLWDRYETTEKWEKEYDAAHPQPTE